MVTHAAPAVKIANAVREAVRGCFAYAPAPIALHDTIMRLVEKPLIEAVLDHFRHNQTHAARALGLNRNTLRKKIRAHRIEAP